MWVYTVSEKTLWPLATDQNPNLALLYTVIKDSHTSFSCFWSSWQLHSMLLAFKKGRSVHWCAIYEMISMVPVTYLSSSGHLCPIHIIFIRFSFYWLTPAEAVKCTNLFRSWPPGSCFILGYRRPKGGGRENKFLGCSFHVFDLLLFNYSKERHRRPSLCGSHAAFSALPPMLLGTLHIYHLVQSLSKTENNDKHSLLYTSALVPQLR